MKKKILLNLLTILCILALTACGKENDSKTEDKNKDSKTAASAVNSSEEETPDLPEDDSDEETPGEQASDNKASNKKTSDEKTSGELIPDNKTSDKSTDTGTASPDREDDSVRTAAAPIPYKDVEDIRIKKICEAYGRYIDEKIQLRPESEYSPTFSTGFIDEDDIPELFYYDQPDSGLLLCTYDEAADSVIELGFFDYGPYGHFNYFFKDCLFANINTNDQTSNQTMYSFDGNNIEPVLIIDMDLLSGSININGEPSTPEEASEQASIYNNMTTFHRVDYVYGLFPDEKGKYSEQIYNVTDWNGEYADSTDYMDYLVTEAMKEFAGDWSLDGVYHYDPITEESTDINPFQCKAKFTVNKKGEYNFSFSHEDVSFSKEADGIEELAYYPYRDLQPEDIINRYFTATAPDKSYSVFILKVDWDTVIVEYAMITDGQFTGIYDLQFTK